MAKTLSSTLQPAYGLWRRRAAFGVHGRRRAWPPVQPPLHGCTAAAAASRLASVAESLHLLRFPAGTSEVRCCAVETLQAQLACHAAVQGRRASADSSAATPACRGACPPLPPR